MDHTQQTQDLATQKLMLAINDQDFNQVKSLLTSNSQIAGCKDSNGDTLLHHAVRRQDIQILEFILNLGLISVHTFNNSGKTPLLLAATQTNLDVMRLLIETGADVNISDSEGDTPLHCATYHNLKENCVFLLENGANVNEQNKRGCTVLHLVCMVHNDIEWVAMFMVYGANASIYLWEEEFGLGYTPFEWCLMDNKVHFQNFLIDYVIDGDVKISILLGALVRAMEHGSPLFPLILDHVSDIVYDRDELFAFMNKIVDCKSEYLKIFIERFEYILKDIAGFNSSRLINSLYRYRSEPSKCHLVVENVYIIFSEPAVTYFFEIIAKPFPLNIISPLIQMFKEHQLPLKSLSELIYHILSYGVPLTDAILDHIYYCFGDGEFFRTLLQMEINFAHVYPKKAPFPAIIYNVELKNIKGYFHEPIFFDLTLICSKMMSFFAGIEIKELCQRSNKKHLKEKAQKLPDVPLLLELARNSGRNFIIDFYGIKTCREFYEVVKKLPISSEYKAIISFQRKIYSVD